MSKSNKHTYHLINHSFFNLTYQSSTLNFFIPAWNELVLHWSTELLLYLGVLRGHQIKRFFKSKIGDFRIFASDFFFFILTLVTSDTFWGQTMSLSQLKDVSNFSWRSKLSFEILFLELGWKLKHPETAISQWVILTLPPASLTDQKACID